MSLFDELVSEDFNEHTISKKNVKDKFLKLLSADGFDFSDIDDATKLPKSLIPVIDNETDAFNKFNICLSKLHKNKIINILDAVSFITGDYLEAPIAIKCLDEMNYIALKNELQKKFKVKQDNEDQELSLLDFLG